MIVYNVTTKVEHGIAGAWLQWLKEEHIPELVATGCFTHAVILRLTETDETEGPTYAVQYHTQSKELYNRYIEIYADAMRKKATDKWGNRFISFRTVMTVVDN
ncbi:MAG: DUF4286 family protein [Chitinophagaceae bacterium]|nr:DUF4286 family protein [Chitinophagaceae bacterium]